MSVPKSNIPNRKPGPYARPKAPRTASPVREVLPEPRDSTDWLRELARQERDRTAEVKRFNSAAASFLKALYGQILTDVGNFRTEFPETTIRTKLDSEQIFIEVVNASSGPPTPQVRVSTNSANQTLLLVFEFRPSLNKELPAAIVDDELVVDIAGHNPFAAISRIVLTPVLFPELTSSTLLYFTETSGLP